MAETPGYVDGLLEERRGYVARGLSGRVAEVDAELKRLGIVVDDAPETAAESTPKENAAKARPRAAKD